MLLSWLLFFLLSSYNHSPLSIKGYELSFSLISPARNKNVILHSLLCPLTLLRRPLSFARFHGFLLLLAVFVSNIEVSLFLTFVTIRLDMLGALPAMADTH